MSFTLPPVPAGTPMVAPPGVYAQPPDQLTPEQMGMPAQYAQQMAMQQAPQVQQFAQQPQVQQFAQQPQVQQFAPQPQAQAPNPEWTQPMAQQVAAPVAPPAQQAAPVMTLEDATRHLLDVRALKAKVGGEYDAWEKGMKGIIGQLENLVMSLIPIGTDVVQLHGHNFKPSEKIRYQTSAGQADEFYAWVKAGSRIELLERRIAQTAMDAEITRIRAWHADNVRAGQIDPVAAPVERYYPLGMEIAKDTVLSVTKATRSANIVKE